MISRRGFLMALVLLGVVKQRETGPVPPKSIDGPVIHLYIDGFDPESPHHRRLLAKSVASTRERWPGVWRRDRSDGGPSSMGVPA